ncbi:MAG: DNA polymerase I [Deltaproteobacteria bacterium]|nr:MAG: DNA polymerase I [Deltaproteobacteria bacterium]
MTKEIYLVDGSAYIYRAYHAVTPLNNSKGLYTHAVFGFINIMRKLVKDRQPEFMLVAWDSRGPVFRHRMYSEYKANRPPMPEDLAQQIPYIKEYIRAANIACLEEAEAEADDIIATAASHFAAAGFKVVIVSGDKDLLQLVGGNITVWEPMKNKVMDEKAVQEKYGVPPSSLLDCFALMGDSSDNVPGVPGVGPKTAQKLINECGSLDQLYAGIDGMKKSKMKEKLIENKEMAYLSRDLIALKTDVKIPLEHDFYACGQENQEALQKLYTELEFNSLLKEVKTLTKVSTAGFNMVTSTEDFNVLLAELEQARLFAIDTETTSLNARKASLVGISLATGLENAWYIPLRHLAQDGSLLSGQLDKDLVLNGLRPHLADDSKAKLGHNLKYDYTVLKSIENIELKGQLIDTMLAAYLIDPTARSLKLDELCRLQGTELTSFAQVTAGDKREDCFAYVSLTDACSYACEDVYAALLLWQEFEPKLKEYELLSLFFEVEAPLIPILAEMEMDGIRVDQSFLADLGREFAAKLHLLEQEIYQLAGREFNINSPSQLGQVLFEELRLPHGRKTKTGYSTDIKVLEKLALRHDLPALIISFRNLGKLQSTYVEKLAELAGKEPDHRVHTSFNQAVTATGRLSSSNPNMQNIPIRTEEGNRIRQAFIPAEKMMFLSADYSQIDLRVLAHYSQDQALLDAFLGGGDIHTRTAAQIFSADEVMVTKEMRRVAKSINFGIVYGMSAFGLAEQLKISRKEAGQFIDRYFDYYSGVKKFMAEIAAQAGEMGFVTTLLSRRRPLPEINAKNKTRREFAQRIAVNTPIQGTAADIIKLAMLGVARELGQQKLSARLLLQVHDELVFELPENELAETRKLIKKVMENVLPLSVPLVVNFEQGTSLAK